VGACVAGAGITGEEVAGAEVQAVATVRKKAHRRKTNPFEVIEALSKNWGFRNCTVVV